MSTFISSVRCWSHIISRVWVEAKTYHCQVVLNQRMLLLSILVCLNPRFFKWIAYIIYLFMSIYIYIYILLYSWLQSPSFFEIFWIFSHFLPRDGPSIQWPLPAPPLAISDSSGDPIAIATALGVSESSHSLWRWQCCRLWSLLVVDLWLVY